MFVQILYLDGFLGRLIYVLVFLDFWPWLNLLWLWNLFVCPSVSYWSPFSSSLSWLQCYHGFRRKTPLIPKQAAAAKSLQSFPTLHDPIDGSPLGSAVPGILQARTLEWAAISFPNAWKWKWSHSVVSDSWRPHGLQPTRLLRTWDFPGKSTGVGCHCLLPKTS